MLLGWTDQMAEVTRAADVVVTNAGGATSLEALATGRPVLMFRPIAGHGRANAAAMARAGVAVLCRDGHDLGGALRRLLDDDAYRQQLEKEAAAAAGGGQVAADVERLLAIGPRGSTAGERPPRRRRIRSLPSGRPSILRPDPGAVNPTGCCSSSPFYRCSWWPRAHNPFSALSTMPSGSTGARLMCWPSPSGALTRSRSPS